MFNGYGGNFYMYNGYGELDWKKFWKREDILNCIDFFGIYCLWWVFKWFVEGVGNSCDMWYEEYMLCENGIYECGNDW